MKPIFELSLCGKAFSPVRSTREAIKIKMTFVTWGDHQKFQDCMTKDANNFYFNISKWTLYVGVSFSFFQIN